MAVYKLQTGSSIEYPADGVLGPDIVTEQLALEASKALAERDWSRHRPTLLELGIGSGAFSCFVLDMSDSQVDVIGVDTNAEAIVAAERNLSRHTRLGRLTLAHGDWNDEATFTSGPFDCIYFNPPYRIPGSQLRPEFTSSPASAVFAEDPKGQYVNFLPRIVENLAVGGMAIVRYPGDGSVTFAGQDARADHSPWVDFAEMDRTLERLMRRSAWLQKVMPRDTRSYMWRSEAEGRRVNAEVFTRIGDSITNAPKIIRDADSYWNAYTERPSSANI